MTPRPRGARARPERESAFQTWVVEAFHLYGWKVAHFRTVRIQRGNGSIYYATPAAVDGEGFPDMVARNHLRSCEPRILFVELKADAGKPEPRQVEWLEALRLAGGEVRVWRPRDRDAILAELQRR